MLFGFLAGAVVGWVVTRLGCLPEGCLGWQVIVAAISGLGAAIGIGVVVVLSIRSLDEWRRPNGRGDSEPTTPGAP